MMIPRMLSSELHRAASSFPAVLLTGPRRAGKTTLFRHTFPKANYVLLEDLDKVASAQEDPRGFLAQLEPPVIIDEIQNAPHLFNYIRTRIDAAPNTFGQWLFTGSQEAPLMKGVSESMAGRIAIFQLSPLSHEESDKVDMLHGGFPEPLVRPATADLWYTAYIQTYLERDVRAATDIRDLAVFRRFVGLVATRSAQQLNKTDLATALGVSVPTITQWIGILELTGQILLIPPFFENFGKRLTKAPKLFFVDTGFLCHLLGVNNGPTLQRSPFRGAIFETFVATELFKHRVNRGLARKLFFFRDQQGLEVDFLVDQGDGNLILLEAKATRTPMPSDGTPMRRLGQAAGHYKTRSYVVHDGPTHEIRSLGHGVEAVGWRDLHSIVGGGLLPVARGQGAKNTM